jgi:hypothetical protein
MITIIDETPLRDDENGFPRGDYLWIAVVIFKIFFVSGFPRLARGFTASLRGLLGLHVTQKPLIRIEDNNLCPKTHHPRVNTHRKLINPNQLLATTYN